MEFAVRFLVHIYVPYDGKLDVEEYMDEGIVELAGASNGTAAADLINRTFALLNSVAGNDALRRFENGHHAGKVGLVGLEGIAVGVAKNIEAILALADVQQDSVRDKIRTFWSQPQAGSFTLSRPSRYDTYPANGSIRRGVVPSMSKPYSDADFSAQITEDRSWRLKEISDLKTAIIRRRR